MRYCANSVSSSERGPPDRIAVIWSPEARDDLRAIDRETAIHLLHCIDRYLSSRTGDVKKLNRRKPGSLRCGDYSRRGSLSACAGIFFVRMETARKHATTHQHATIEGEALDEDSARANRPHPFRRQGRHLQYRRHRLR